MEEIIQELRIKMEKEYQKSMGTQEKLLKKIKGYFDFEIIITYCEGDGFLILDEETSDVFTFNVLNIKKKGIKLTRNDCFDYTL